MNVSRRRGLDGHAPRWHPDWRSGLPALLIAVVLVGIPSLVSAQTLDDAAHRSSPYAPLDEPVLGPAPSNWPTPGPVPGAAYVLVDARTGQLLAGHEADRPRAVASTVKVLTALSVVARAELDDRVTAGDEVRGVPGAGVGLRAGDTWRVRQLLDAIIARSGNEAAQALAVHVGGSVEGFLEMMITDAAALGLEPPPRLVSPSGLDDANQLSAADLATLARAALADPELRPFLGRREVVLPSEGRVETRNQLLLDHPDATGVKTGYTLAAGYCLIGSARRDGRELIAVVLGAGEDPTRFDAAAALLDHGFERFRSVVLDARLTFAVAGGERVFTVPDTPLMIPAGDSTDLRLPLTAQPPEGDVRVGVEVAGEMLASVIGTMDPDTAPAPAASDDARIGRAAVDGAYAALRAAAVGDVLR